MKKSGLYIGAALCCLGAAWLAAAWLLEAPLLEEFTGLAGAVLGMGLGSVLRWRAVSGTSQSGYAREMRRAAVERRDERAVMLRDRAGYLTMNAAMGALAAGWLGLRAMEALGRWMPYARYASWACCGLLGLMLLCYWVVFRLLGRRM